MSVPWRIEPLRIEGIHIQNFLSFGDFNWNAVDPRLNAIVGPNGAGKTNLFRAFRALLDGLNYEHSNEWTDEFNTASGQKRFVIAFDIRLTSDWEKDFLACFVRAAYTDETVMQRYLGQQAIAFSPETSASFSQIVHHGIRRENVEWLFQGRLTVEFDERRSWSSRYQPASVPDSCVWYLDDRRGHGSSVFGGGPNQGYNDIFEVWISSLDETQRKTFGFPGAGATGGEWIYTLDPRTILCDETRANGIHLAISGQPQSETITYRDFEDLLGARLESNHGYDGRFVFREMLRRAIVFTDNVRVEPRESFKISEITSGAPTQLSDGANLPVFLFREKNGAATARKHYGDVKDVFNRITGAKLDVGLDQITLDMFGKPTIGETELPLTMRVAGDRGDMSLRMSGAGLAEVAYLSALIVGDSDRIILLDEPALNLHPATQASVAKEIEENAANQFLAITHAQRMIPVDSVTQISRFYLRNGVTCRAAPSKNDDRRYLENLSKELRRSADTRDIVFSRGVILVEGETETAALSVWFDEIEDRILQRQSLALLSVNGYPQFENYLRFANAFAIPWVIVCDGDAIGPMPDPQKQGSKKLDQQLRDVGVQGVPSVDYLNFKERKEMLQRFGVLTLADAADENFESLPVVKECKAHLPPELQGNRSRVRLGRYCAENYPCPSEAKSLLHDIRRDFVATERSVSS